MESKHILEDQFNYRKTHLMVYNDVKVGVDKLVAPTFENVKYFVLMKINTPL